MWDCGVPSLSQLTSIPERDREGRVEGMTNGYPLVTDALASTRHIRFNEAYASIFPKAF